MSRSNTSFNIPRTRFTGNDLSFSDQEIEAETKKIELAKKKKAGTFGISTLDEIDPEDKINEWNSEMNEYED